MHYFKAACLDLFGRCNSRANGRYEKKRQGEIPLRQEQSREQGTTGNYFFYLLSWMFHSRVSTFETDNRSQDSDKRFRKASF